MTETSTPYEICFQPLDGGGPTGLWQTPLEASRDGGQNLWKEIFIATFFSKDSHHPGQKLRDLEEQTDNGRNCQ